MIQLADKWSFLDLNIVTTRTHQLHIILALTLQTGIIGLTQLAISSVRTDTLLIVAA